MPGSCLGALLLALLFAAPAAQAQTNHVSSTLAFANGVSDGLTDVNEGSTSVGDFDGDGDLDLLITGDRNGTPTAKIYTNDGDGTFSQAGAADDALKGVELSSSSVGDFDGDGHLDLLITGRRGNRNKTAKIYVNDGNGTFSQAGAADDALAGVDVSSTSVGDFDGDDDLDLLLTGRVNANNQIARVYTNDGNGTFTKDGSSSPNMRGVKNSSTSVGDFDGDGDLDLLITGNRKSFGVTRTAKSYVNNDATFDGAGSADDALKGVHRSSSSVGDFDGDGDLDLLITGDRGGKTAKIYVNDGNGTFSQAGDADDALAGVEESSTSMGDFDGDGDLDLLLTGRDNNNNQIARVYTNDGSGTFTEAGTGDGNLTGVEESSTSAEDFDGDGDLDLLITGLGNSQTTTVYENTSTTTLTIEGTDGTGQDDGWRVLGAPRALTRGDLNDDFTFDFNNVSSGAVAHVWDAGAQQWSPLQSDTAPIDAGQGVALYFFDDADDPIGAAPNGLALQMPGTPNAQSDVTLTGLGTGQFVFIANPYLQELDLGAATLTGFQTAVQVYDPANGFQVRTAGIDNIAALQGVFLERTTPGSGPTSLTLPADGLQGGSGSFIGTKSQAPALASAGVKLRLVVESEGDTLAQNRATVLFHEGAAADWDAYDATQLLPPGAEAHATLTSPIERSGQLARRTQAAEPFPEGPPAEVPLSARSVGVDGTAHIELLQAPDASGPIELIDAETGATVDLRAESYSFPLAAGDGSIESPSEARFTLRAGAGALPVELTRLTATPDAGGVLLEWTTASETRNAGFEIERQAVGEESAASGDAASGDASSGDAASGAASGDWTTIGFVEGAGTTTEAQAYRFRAEDLPVGTHRFRLRQLDADGTATLSAPVTAAVRLAEAYRLTAPAPNPATTGATMRLAVRQPQAVRVAVYDVLGRAVRVLLDGPMSAQQPTTLRVGEGLPAGQYFVRAVGEHFRATERLTIVR